MRHFQSLAQVDAWLTLTASDVGPLSYAGRQRLAEASLWAASAAEIVNADALFAVAEMRAEHIPQAWRMEPAQ